MRLPKMLVAVGVAAALAGAMPPASAATPGKPVPSRVRDVCGTAAPGSARCFAEVRTDVHGGTGVRGPAAKQAGKAALPAGYGPADLRSAYKLPSTGGAKQTVAVVDAGDDPAAEADLAVYRKTYGLPACTTANGCFHKVNQAGKPSPLPPDQGWAVEIALDLDMVSASCPSCHLLLVEGDDSTFDGLGKSENTAAKLGATEISNSYGGTEQNGLNAYAAYYRHPGVAIVASSGDDGYGIPNTPAVYQSVIAVGGTSLTKAKGTARGWKETAWGNQYGGAGSGCSAWIAKPAWQKDKNCAGRMVADVAADADPVTGPAVYDTDPNGADGTVGWIQVGGTSASSPFIAGVIALAGNPGTFPNASSFYRHTTALNDVVGGNNGLGVDCGGDYQCNGVHGYDGPTGNGTPNGIKAF
jgi:subtilase family serine protease